MRVSQRTISANGAPPAAAPGAVGSPFAIAGQYLATVRGAAGQPDEKEASTPPADPPPAATTSKALLPRAKQVLEACGPLTVDQLAEEVGIELKRAARLVKNAAYRGVLRLTADDEGREVVEITPPAGLKKANAMKPTAAKRKAVSPRKNGGGRSPRAGKEPSAAAVKHWRGQPANKARELATQAQRGLVPAPAITPLPRGSGGFRCGLYSDGSLEIHTEAQSLDLSRDQVRELVAYLDKLASALAE